MSNETEKPKNINIKGMTPKEFFATAPSETPKMKAQGIWSKFKSIADFFGIRIFGIRIGDSTASKGAGGYGSTGSGHVESHQTSSARFRAEHRHQPGFDPERAYIERMQERAYMGMVDGRGDPEHDCDHEH